jgi:hypothetical protein
MEIPVEDGDRSLSKWAYDNAIKVLLTLAVGAWGLAFAAWAANVNDAKVAYVAGQKEMTDALRAQQDMREKYAVLKDRQDRVILVLDELEKRVRFIEVSEH